MSEVGFYKSDNNNIKEVTKKLKVMDYAFEIDNENIEKVEVTYAFGNMVGTHFKDGKKTDKITHTPYISFELNGTDNKGNTAWISFEINISLDKLNTYTEKPTDITEFLSLSESFLKRPNWDKSGFLDFDIPLGTIEDMKKDLTSLYVSKKKTNVFIFKLSVPSERVFTFFIVDFND